MPLVAEAGGTERITSLIANGLRAKGHDCMSILQFFKSDSDPIYEGEHITDVYKFLKNNNIDIVINQIGNDKWLLEQFLKKGGKKWQQEGGIILTCLHFYPKPLSSLYFNKFLLRNTIRDYLRTLKLFILYPYYQKRQNIQLSATYNWLYNRSNYFIVLSRSYIPYMERDMGRGHYNKLIAINNPLTFPDISPASIIDGKEKIVLVCSRMDEFYKRISLILKAWRIIESKEDSKGWKLIILGEGVELERYKNMAQKLKLKRYEFMGRQNPEPYYEKASIHLMTSINEGWGLTLTESLQRGVVPVVMNTSSAFEDIIHNGYNGFLTKPNSLKAFTSKILLLMKDSNRLKEMQLNALKSASKFSLDSTIERWLRLL